MAKNYNPKNVKVSIGGKEIRGYTAPPSVQDEWSVMKDALMEKGFELEYLDRFMKRYVKAWIQKHIGLISEWRLDSNHDYDNLGGFGISRFYEGVATIIFRGGTNKDAHEILTFLSDPSDDTDY